MAKILIVDDDKTTLTVLSGLLEKAGHVAIQTQESQKAIDLIHAHAPDLVITDIYMPDQDGIEIIGKLRRRDQTLPIITISGGHALVGDYLQLAVEMGANKALHKPIDSEQLLSAVDELLG